MIVRSSVLLPTPLRPRIERLWFALSMSETPSSTTASPYPARTSRSSSMRLSQVDLAHARIAADLFGRALDEDAAADHHDDAAGEAEHHVHVVLDEEDGELARQRLDGAEEGRAFVLRHPGGGL